MRIGNFPHFHTQTAASKCEKSRHADAGCAAAPYSGRTPKPNHKNALIRKRGAKNYMHTHTQTAQTPAQPPASSGCQPITEFVYESPGKSNTKKMLTAAQRAEHTQTKRNQTEKKQAEIQKKSVAHFVEFFAQLQMAAARTRSRSYPLSHTHAHIHSLTYVTRSLAASTLAAPFGTFFFLLPYTLHCCSLALRKR